MDKLNPKVIYYIAKKEFMDNVRNRWIILLTVIFVILTIVASFLAGGQSGHAGALGGMEETVVALISISSLLIPLIAIILGFSTISGEAESGALSVVLSYPVRRMEVLFGKFLGLGSVLVASTILGFGLGGIVIALTVSAESSLAYLAFIGLAIVLGFVYLSAILCFSALCKKRVTSIGAGILLFFWAQIYGMVVFGIYLATGGNMEGLVTSTVTFPDWLWGSVVFSPIDTNQMAVMQAFGMEKAFGYSLEAPEFLNLGFLLFVLLLWIVIPLILGYIFFKRRDI